MAECPSRLYKDGSIVADRSLIFYESSFNIHDAKLTLHNNPKGGAEIILNLKVFSHKP
jgi:hypothetical protein